ncbi:MAG: PA2779 family protein [Pseudomonas sp.]
MAKNTPKARLFTVFLSLVFALFSLQIPAHAAIVTTGEIASAAQLDVQKQQVIERLLQQDVKDQLLSLGVDPADVADRVASLSEAELQQIEGQLDNLPAGAGLGTVAVVLLILILLEVAGVIDIFPRL